MGEVNSEVREGKLNKTLKPIHLWAIAVGMVISGQYYGFSYGYAEGGPFGLLIAFLIVTVFYVTFVFCYTELATSIPHAGGPNAYARRAMGPFWGFLSGFSILIELVFAPAAVVLSIGAYIHFLIPAIPSTVATIVFLVVFIGINYLGVKLSAIVELIVTVAALVGLLMFYVLAAPNFSSSNILTDPILPNGSGGIFAAITYAIWFYLALEGAAMSAEEMKNPRKDIPKAYIPAIFTLFITAFFTLIFVGGIADYTKIASEDFPLPLALSEAFGENHVGVLLIGIFGIIALVASLQGIIVGYSRQAYAMSRSGYLPKFLSKVHPKRKVPHWALIIPAIVTLMAALSGVTDTIIDITVFGAVLMYFISVLSVIVLRKKEPKMERPFKVFYPIIPIISLIFATVLVISSLIFNFYVVKYVLIVYALAIAYYFIWARKQLKSFDEEFNIDV